MRTEIILAVMAIGGSFSTNAQGAANLAQELLNTTSYINDAKFEVLIPSALDPIVYDVTLQSEANAEPDSLAPCRYLIRWSTESAQGTNEGFSAYYDGNHYRYRNNRLQEYHAEANVDPFRPLGPGSERNGVQYTAQFADMLPQFIGSKLQEMFTDSSYVYTYHPDTLVNNRRAIVLDGVKRGSGFDQMTYSYVFDKDTHMPVSIDIESNPGSISEQIVNITYQASSEAPMIDISETGLMDAYPDIFDKYRQSTFRAENLNGTPLPQFSCQVLGSSDRFSHHLDEGFSSPVIIVALDPDIATTTDAIAAVRDAVDQAPMDMEVIYAFNSNDSQTIEKTLGKLRRGETALTSASSLLRSCGITMYPTTILVDRNATVRDVMAGYNNDMSLIVLQKAMLLK